MDTWLSGDHETQVRNSPWPICQEGDFLMIPACGDDPKPSESNWVNGSHRDRGSDLTRVIQSTNQDIMRSIPETEL